MIERYTRPAMGKIWSEENRYLAWLEVELAICGARACLGDIPEAALNGIRAKAKIDISRIREIEEVTRHDVIAFLTSLEEIIGPDARYIHQGCTSSDIVDTANALLVQQAGRIILADLDQLLLTLKRLAKKYKGALCMGRTHGMHAEPVSFGLKLAGFYAEFDRHKTRFEQALAQMATGKISGAVGTYTFTTPALEREALERLGLKPDTHSTQIVQRDRYAHFFCVLAILGGGIERLSLELRHLQRTEVGEAEEGFSRGQKGSSAMPHKKNPVSAENLCGIARVLRGNALAALENQALWHERDISHSSAERVIMPDSTILADYALARLAAILENLVVHPDQMRKNMDLSFGLYLSQQALNALLQTGMERQKAYEKIQELAMRSWCEKSSFPQLAMEDEMLVQLLGRERLEQLFSSDVCLRHEDEIFERVFGDRWQAD